MESWSRVIVEWVNCLGIAQSSIEDLQDLENCAFYKRLVNQLCSGNDEIATTDSPATTTTMEFDERELVSEFIKAEYPEFMASNECGNGISDELYTASLLLTQCSQNPAFHRPMCLNLKHETQVHIKKFLELVLPYGKSLTREVIAVAITELGDATPNTPPSTPKPSRPLREFFNSPAARSAQSQRFMNDRNRELRRLRAQLETEQFEKTDLIEDMRIQDEKIQNLQKKLHEKSQELKALRNERLKPPTPQSCRKNKRPSDSEERYKRELEQLENVNATLQSEIDQLQDEREELTRRLTSKDRMHTALKQKFDHTERSLEALTIQMEMKNNELLDMRMNNEQLREHIREIQRSSLGEQSFEMEPIGRVRSPALLNSNEALSSIIDIQLQEAKEESAQLKIQLDGMNQRLETVIRECEEIKLLNAVLHEKTAELDGVKLSLRSTEERLSSSTAEAKSLKAARTELNERLQNLGTALESNRELLASAVKRRDALESDLGVAQSRNRELETCLENEKSRVVDLESSLAEAQKEYEDLKILLATTDDKLSRVNEDKRLLELDLEDRSKKLEKSEISLTTERSKVAELESLLDRAKKESEQLQNLLTSSEQKICHIVEDKETLELNLAKSTKKLEESEDSLKNERSRIAELESIVVSAKKESAGLENLLKLNEEQLSDATRKKKAFESDLEATAKKLEVSELNLKNQTLRVTELESIVVSGQRESEDLRNLLQSKETLLINERARVADLETTVARAEKDAEDLQAMLDELKTALNNEIKGTAELKDIVSRSKKTSEELESLLQSKEELLEKSLQRGRSLDAELESSKRRVTELELSLESETSKTSALESELSCANETCESLKATLASTKQFLAKSETDKTHLESKLHRAEATIRETEEKIDNLRTELSTIEEQKMECLSAKSEIEEYAKNADDKIATLESKISDCELRIKELDGAMAKEIEISTMLRNELSAENSINDALTLRLEESEKRESAASARLEAAEKKVVELTELGEAMGSQLSQVREQLSSILAEKKSLEEELSSRVRLAADIDEEISKLKQKFEESEERFRDELVANTVLKKNESELQEIKAQLEDKLTQEQNHFALTLREKNSLEKELDSYVQSADSMKEQIERIEKELEVSQESLREQNAANSNLKKTEFALQEIKVQLEDKLTHEQNQLAVMLSEKNALETELASYVQSAANMTAQIERIERDLEESQKNLQRQNAANEVLKKTEFELEKIKIQLEDDLTQEQNQLALTLSEKNALEKELASYSQSVASLNTQIERLEKELDESRKNLQEQSVANAVLKKSEFELQEIKIHLEDELTREQTHLAHTLIQKNTLEKELAVYVQSSANMKEHIGKIEEELEKCNERLQEQLKANATLEKEQIELNEQRSNLENKLELNRQELVDTKMEKDALNEKLSTHVHSERDLKERIDKIEKHLEESQKQLRDQLAANELLREEESQQKEQKAKLEKELSHERERLTAIQDEKEMLQEEASLYGRSNEDLGAKIVALNGELEGSRKDLQEKRDELSSLIRSQTDMIAEMSALQTELKSLRNDLRQLQDANAILKEKSLEANARIENLVVFEAKSSQLTDDLESTRNECASLREKIVELSEESARRAADIKSVSTQLDEAKREKDRLCDNLNERIQSSNDLVASLEKRLLGSQNACAEAKIEEKLKEEALGVLHIKLEQLTKEKIESELRMKEVIMNLQEVRRSQDDVLEAQVKALKEKSSQLEGAEKELVSVKTSLEAKLNELEKEHQLSKETGEKQSKLVQELQEALETERNVVKELTARCEDLKNDMEDVAKVSGSLKLEFKELWDSVSQACPEGAVPREGKASEFKDNLETTKITDAIQSFAVDAKIIRKAVAILAESNDKFKSNIAELAKVSRSLKLELDALWDSVRQACPELARPKEEISCLEETLDNPKTMEISYAVQSFAEDAKTIRKAVSILSEANETLKDHLDGEKNIAKSSASEAEKIKIELDQRIASMESEREKRDQYLSLLVRRKKDLQELLSNAVAKRDEVDDELGTLTERWRRVSTEAQSALTAGSSACDELKHLQIRRTELDEILAKVNDRHARGLKPLLKALCRIFLWSETKLQEAQLISVVVKNEFSPQSELSDEQQLLKVEICNNDKVREDLTDVRERIDSFSSLLKSYETSLKAGVIKREATNEEKLQAQVEKITKERKEMRDKIDAMRTRNAKLEKNMDDLRNENKKLKSDASSVAPTGVAEVERLEKLTEKLEQEIQRLQRDNDELSKMKSEEPNEEARLKEIHNEYGLKLEKIKQKMKTAYNEQIAKLNQEQEKAIKDKLEALRGQMEQQCRKYTEDIAKYKAHISDLSSRYWDVGEKLLAETQEKQAALQQLQQLKGQQQQAAIAEVNQQMTVAQSRQKTASLDRRDFGADRAARESRPGYRAVEMIEEETTTYSTRRRSVQSIQAMGNAFNAEDEEGEVFDSVYLADLKEGRCAPMGPDFERLSELRMRNSMCRPHLRSSYAVETHVQPITLNEDDIKNGVTGDDVFNDSLSQSLLPGQKPKKKDRTQTSYKRPGPPTPSKNGGRLSLQGNELKSPGSRILRERNVDRRTTATPKGLKNLFGTSISKRQDENVAGTPKGRRLSNIFRKQRTDRN